MGTPQGREGTWTTREPPGNSPALGTWLQMLPQAPALGPDLAQLGPGSPQVNVIGRHQGPETLDAFIGRGLGALGDRSRTGHSPFSSSSGQILESGGRWVQV